MTNIPLPLPPPPPVLHYASLAKTLVMLISLLAGLEDVVSARIPS